jgi:type II secretory pathway pseudopilin PulG
MKKERIGLVRKFLIVVMILGMVGPSIVRADQGEDARIKKLEAAVEALQAELNALKAERAEAAKQVPAVDQKQLEKLVEQTFEKRKDDLGAVPDWVKNTKISGDFRYRYESLDRKPSDDTEFTNERRRNRIRARLQFKTKINDEWDTIFRIASGSSDVPTSTNQTLDNTFETKDLWLDLAYANWHPDSRPGLNMSLGKMKNPFYNVGKNELIWDGDVNPEGGAASYSWKLNKSDTASLVGGAFWLDERSTDADAGYFGIQGMLKHKFDNGSHLLGGATYYDIGNIDSKSADSDDTGVTLLGNTDAGGTTYMYDYDLYELFGEYGFKCNGMPVAIFSNYVQNTAAPGGRNTGYNIGAQLNKAKKPGSWQFKASYREVESDAVFAGLTDSDFIDGGTGGKGWELGFKYQLAKNIQAALTYFINERDRRVAGGSGSQNFNRLQGDLVFKF